MAVKAESVGPIGASEHVDPGVLVARAYQKAFAAVLLAAWVSLAVQLPVLAGSRGLLPVASFFERLREGGVGWAQAPSILWLAHSDAALLGFAWLGAAIALAALCGVAPRACFAISAPLYLSYAIACDDFTAFQWDNMLVEVALLSALLPANRPAPVVRFALRLLLFKLYFESGLAKWQSPLRDWQDGSAMAFYYETAPLPGPLAWRAHHLPQAWHHLESWGALVLELVVPFFAIGPRALRLIAFAALTGFQIINTATANYGFFTYLSVALHLLLLEDRDLLFVFRKLRAPRLPTVTRMSGLQLARGMLTGALLAAWLFASFMGGALRFARSPETSAVFGPSYRALSEYRVANIYQLFGHITRERIEPQLQLRVHGEWSEHDLAYKAGDVMRAPGLVAPHQPRVDFRLWFYGLSFRQGMPEFVANLLERLCCDRQAVQPLFAAALPSSVEAVRLTFFRYRFTTPAERAQTGAVWAREELGHLPDHPCAHPTIE